MKNNKQSLTAGEVRIFKLLIKGLTNEQIAKKLGIKPNTVKFHNTSIYKKYEVNGKTQLILKNKKGKK